MFLSPERIGSLQLPGATEYGRKDGAGKVLFSICVLKIMIHCIIKIFKPKENQLKLMKHLNLLKTRITKRHIAYLKHVLMPKRLISNPFNSDILNR